jgi:Ser/Thr protein kinase RdoA (MazF antagonist)
MSRTDFCDQLDAELAKRYGWQEINNPRRLDGGLWSDVFRIETEHGPIAVKIGHDRFSLRRFEFEENLVRGLAKRIPEVVVPLAALDGATYFLFSGRPVTVTPYVEGELAIPGSASNVRLAAQLIARVHRAGIELGMDVDREDYPPLARLDLETNRMWNWSDIRDLLDGSPALQERARSAAGSSLRDAVNALLSNGRLILSLKCRIAAWIDRVCSGKPLQSGFVHGDFTPRNVLLREGRVIGVLDWEDCQREWLLADVVKSAWEFGSDLWFATVNYERLKEFTQNYATVFHCEPAVTFEVFLDFLRSARMIEVLYALGDALMRDRWFPTYALINLRVIRELDGILGER